MILWKKTQEKTLDWYSENIINFKLFKSGENLQFLIIIYPNRKEDPLKKILRG